MGIKIACWWTVDAGLRLWSWSLASCIFHQGTCISSYITHMLPQAVQVQQSPRPEQDEVELWA